MHVLSPVTTKWKTSHLTTGAWYLDYVLSFAPSFETELKKSRDDIDEPEIEMVDLARIEDENELAKALKRSIGEDRKKALKVKETS